MFRLLFICLLCFCTGMPARDDGLRFQQYSVEDGLLQSNVNISMLDSRGFMWFGTQVGLNRFDGSNFSAFKHHPSDTSTLSDNWIWSLFEDSKGNIWVGTFHGGLNRYSYADNRFRRYQTDAGNPSSLSNNTIWSILEGVDGDLWIGSDSKINRFDPDSGTATQIPLPGNNVHGFKLAFGRDGKLWIASTYAALELDTASYSFRSFPYFPSDTLRSAGNISRLITDNLGNVWFGTSTGLFRLNPHRNPPEYATLRSLLKSPSPQVPVNISWLQAQKGGPGLWIGSRNGLFLLDSISQPSRLTAYVHDPGDPESLSNNYVISIAEPVPNTLWIGTRNGLNHYDPYNNKFAHVRPRPGDLSSLGQSNVMTLLEDRDNSLWVGNHGGLDLFDPQQQVFRHFRHNSHEPASSLAHNFVLILHDMPNGDIWIGTNGGGISHLTDAERRRALAGQEPRFINYTSQPEDSNSLVSGVIYCILTRQDGSIWIGHAGGISIYDKQQRRFSRFATTEKDRGLLHTHIYGLLEDRQQRLWAATVGGLHLYDEQNQQFKAFLHDPADPLSISSNFITSLYETASGELWIATSGGINHMQPWPDMQQAPLFTRYREEDGLPDNFVYCMLEDSNQNLWISTNKGLARFTRNDSLPRFRIYTKGDGLQSNEFSQNAAYKSRTGMLYFGGIDGFCFFYPDSIYDNPQIPPVAITDLRILNESVPVSADNSTPLSRSILETDSISLSWRDDVLSFEFAALSYTRPEKNQYAYKMVGFDSDWIFSANRRFATYTNLDPGTYIFRVKASNNDGIWNETGKALHITITPPPWQTWWAYTLYFALMVGCIAAYVRYQMSRQARKLEEQARIERAKMEERERVRKESSADFHDEAGNVITKIKLFTELAKRSADKESPLGDYLQRIDEHTRTLASGMRDFIWVLDPEKDSLYETILRLRDFGNSMFEHSDSHFAATLPADKMRDRPLSLPQRRSIVLIFKEAMNNCLKYARASEVHLHSELTGAMLVLCLQDNGIGFDSAGSSAGYGLRNMTSRAGKIGATIRISSAPGDGTKVELRLPLAEEAGNS